MKSRSAHFTGLLNLAKRGDQKARDSALEDIYAEVRALAGQFLRGERRGHTLQNARLAQGRGRVAVGAGLVW